MPTTSAQAIDGLCELMGRTERICTQQRHNKKKLYALHTPEVEYIGKGQARKP